MEIKIISDSQYEETAKMIERTVRHSQFSKFYPQIEIKNVVKSLDTEGVKKRASWTHLYVLTENSLVVGCGAIGEYWGSKTESSFFSIFVDPEYQGKGYGRKIIEALEQDELFKRAKRIEILAAMSAIPFYRKMGYEHKNGQLIFFRWPLCIRKI